MGRGPSRTHPAVVERLRIEFRPEARAEVASAERLYRASSEAMAESFVTKLGRTLSRIVDGPNRWPVFRRDARKVSLHRFPYLVIYREEAGVVHVLAVTHAHCRPGYWEQR